MKVSGSVISEMRIGRKRDNQISGEINTETHINKRRRMHGWVDE
tara:strand:+ start:1040 stop:1171 length:132 start_codon:yes stop_codon:yes gene_type:complete